jgi:hypothetical protein
MWWEIGVWGLEGLRGTVNSVFVPYRDYNFYNELESIWKERIVTF